jgi:hypothetical protein
MRTRIRLPLFLLLFAATAGVSFQSIGLIYLLDVFSIILAAAAVLRIIYHREMMWILCLFLFPIMAFALDSYNETPSGDALRGIFRNTVFVSSAIAAYFWSRRLSLGQMLPLIYGCYFSFSLWYLLKGGELGLHYSNFIKFGFGFFLVQPLIWPFRHWPLLIELILVGAGVLLVGLMDCRAMGAVCILTSGLSVLRKISYSAWAARLILYGLASIALLGGLVLFEEHYNKRFADVYEDRRAKSDDERIDMAQDAWNGFRTSPWVGNGTWQHARQYVSTVNKDVTVGVHSWVVQLAYEYGIFGLIFGATIICLLIIALANMYFKCRARIVQPWSNFPFTVLLLVQSAYYVIMGPFNGPSRLFEGISMGIALAVIFSFDRLVHANATDRSLQVRKTVCAHATQ